METNKPAIIWFSDPVRPDETVVVQGDGFTTNSSIEVCRLEDAAGKGCSAEQADWKQIVPVQADEKSVKFVLPADWQMGAFICRVRTGRLVSKEIIINGPDAWWLQGDLGIEGSPGGWLRIFGKSLNFGGESRVILRSSNGGREYTLKAREADCYALLVDLPGAVMNGDYKVHVHNGFGGETAWKEAGLFTVRHPAKWKGDIFNVTDFGADPYDDNDSTPAVLKALEKASANGGGIVYFPRGRYTLTDMLKIPPFVTLKGEGMELVNLFWPDSSHKNIAKTQGKKWHCLLMQGPCLIRGGDSFAIEDLSLYTQGEHHGVIAGIGDNIRIRRVRIRAFWLHCLDAIHKEHNGRRVDNDPQEADVYGKAIILKGKNIEVTDCDIYHSTGSLELSDLQGALIARNQLHYGSYFHCYGAQGLIFENNECKGIIWGGCVSIYHETFFSQHVYFAHNTFQHVYKGDREVMTFDGHGTTYLGKIQQAKDKEIILAKEPVFGSGARALMPNWHKTTLYILNGKGTGQYRRITGCEGKKLELEREWTVVPDSTSIVCMGAFNGRHLFIGNTAKDGGFPVALFPPNIECIVAENKSYRCAQFMSGGALRFGIEEWGGISAEPSWFHQFFDNTIVEGNGWVSQPQVLSGKAKPQVPGGEAKMLVYGANTQPDYAFPISRCQIIRRHTGENNSSMRIVGAIDNLLAENCVFRKNKYGIEVDKERYAETIPTACHTPRNVLLRNNRFEDIQMPYYGRAIETAFVMPAPDSTGETVKKGS